jgi:hypothetical protein
MLVGLTVSWWCPCVGKARYSLSNVSGFDRVLVYKLTYSVDLSTINRNRRLTSVRKGKNRLKNEDTPKNTDVVFFSTTKKGIVNRYMD